MLSSLGKQQIDLIRHRELNALRRIMTKRAQSTSTTTGSELSTFTPTPYSPATQTMARIDALEAQMTTMASPTVLAPSTTFKSNAVAHSPARSRPEHTHIHEAASYFAANQRAQAQLHLEHAIAPLGMRCDHMPTWLTLLDLFRATNQSAHFDALAMDFAIRFGRSTPSWLSFPALAAATQKSNLPLASSAQSRVWTAAPQLSTDGLALLGAFITTLANQRAELVLDWRQVAVVNPTDWEALAHALQNLADAHIQCTVLGSGQLSQVLNARAADSASAALAQLAWLRCLGAAQAFDDAAIAYCAAFEVSPPDWKAPACKLVQGDDVFYLNTIDKPTSTNRLKPSVNELDLTGEITERLPPAFAAYIALSTVPDKVVTVPCERLVRIDPAATLELRLWSSALHAQGVSVTLMRAHRLVAAFWLSQGIYAFAKVTPRSD